MKLKLIATINMVFFLLAGQVLAASARADVSLHSPISDQQIRQHRLDIATVINNSVLELTGGDNTGSMVRFEPLALKKLRNERFHYEGFSDFHYAVTRFAHDDKTGDIAIGTIVSFTDALLRRSSISMLLTCRWMKNDIDVVEAKVKQLVPSKIMSVLFVVPEQKVPKTLLKEGNHARLMEWLSHNALAINDCKNIDKDMYYLFSANLDRLEEGAKIQLKISAQQEGGDGNTYGGIDIDYEGWHVAIAKIDKKTLCDTNLFAKLIYIPPDFDSTRKRLLRIGLFPLGSEVQKVIPMPISPADTQYNGTIHKTSSDGQSIKATSVHNIYPSADAYVYAYSYRNWNRSNRGGYDQLRAGWHPTGGESRSYIKFDLSNVAPSKVNKAVLRLYHFQTAGNDGVGLGIYRVTGPWNEGADTYHSGSTEKTAGPGEISWVQQPPIDTQPIISFNPGRGLGNWIEVDITPLVKQWLTGTPNYGLVIKSIGHLTQNTPASVYHFASRERKSDLDNPKGKSKAPMLILSENPNGGNAITQPPPPSIFQNALGKPCGTNREFVRSLYQSILGRDLDVSYTNNGRTHLQNLQNGDSRWKIIWNFFNSTEYKDKQKNHEEFIRDAYQSILGRKPADKEIGYWPKVARNDILRKFFNSEEYLKLIEGCTNKGQAISFLSINGTWNLNQDNG